MDYKGVYVSFHEELPEESGVPESANGFFVSIATMHVGRP